MEITWHDIKEEGFPRWSNTYLFATDTGNVYLRYYRIGDSVDKYVLTTHWAEIPVPEKTKSELIKNKCYNYSTCNTCPLNEYCGKGPTNFNSLLDYIRYMVKNGKELLKKYGESEE